MKKSLLSEVCVKRNKEVHKNKEEQTLNIIERLSFLKALYTIKMYR